MRIQRATPINDFLAKMILLILPTTIMSYVVLNIAIQYFSVLSNQAWNYTTMLAVGMVGSAVFYAFRFRFLPTFAILLFILYSIYKGIDAVAVGEFDSFFLSIKFLISGILITVGWLIGWGFIRLRIFPYILAVLFFSLALIFLSKDAALFSASENRDVVIRFLSIFSPVILYTVYIIYVSELIRSYKDKNRFFWWFISKRIAIFGLLAAFLLTGTYYILGSNIKETMSQIGGGGEGNNSMLKKDPKSNHFDLEDYLKLRSNLGRSNDPLFAAHIDNFFPDSDVPNPLYLTAFYYAKFDTLTETFEKDSLMPDKDLFEPNLTTIPLFSIREDSSVLRYALQEDYRRTVEIEVYKQRLSPETFTAPSTAFFVQPITIEKDFRSEFTTAYRAKSYVSELNSAYFVYNADDPTLRKFQEQRFEILRKVKNYDNADKALMDYYTFMPMGGHFDQIRDLAKNITKDAVLPIDKIIAVRDYFLSKDENGEPLYKYTDNPGIPDIPSASKLHYFLFENKKGYCAYYAGATLFMLRALGIPTRITAGFLTEDRSGDKNKGWYWYYADQAHAWVQVYFPGYGWLDFDTTVGNDDARESPQADGTPPLQPPKAYLAGDGVIDAMDTTKKTAKLITKRMVYHDKEFLSTDTFVLDLDLSSTIVRKDSLDVPFDLLHNKDSVTIVSYSEVLKKIKPLATEQLTQILNRIPKEIPVDEIYIKLKPHEIKAKKDAENTRNNPTNWIAIGWGILFSILCLALLIINLPRWIFGYFRWKYKTAKNTKQKSYFAFRSATFFLHQLGYPRNNQTAMRLAMQTDNQFGTAFTQFMIPYLKLKYSDQPLNDAELNTINEFLHPFLQKVKSHIPFKHRFIRFFYTARAIDYFMESEE